MLALRTGWTPDVLAELPATFRGAAHWTLYAEAFAGVFTDLLSATRRDPPDHLTGAARVEFMSARRAAREALPMLRDDLFPPDEESTHG